MFVAVHGATVKGVADYVDEAQDFAERFSGMRGKVAWTPAGEMITIDKAEHTGWRLMVMQP